MTLWGLERIGGLIPVTPVPLACAAIQSLDSEFIARSVLVARMEELKNALVELNGRVIRADRNMEETLDRALLMLQMRRVLIPEGGGFVVLPRNRELVSYYANSIAHLLGPFERAVREVDMLPVIRLSNRKGRTLARRQLLDRIGRPLYLTQSVSPHLWGEFRP